MVRRILGRDGPVTLHRGLASIPAPSLGFGTVGGAEVPIVCLPGDPGAALIGFEVLARPVIQVLAGAEPVFRPERAGPPAGDRLRRRPGCASSGRRTCRERRGGGYTVQPLPVARTRCPGWPRRTACSCSGERVMTATAGSTVDVLLLDRRR